MKDYAANILNFGYFYSYNEVKTVRIGRKIDKHKVEPRPNFFANRATIFHKIINFMANTGDSRNTV